MAHLVFFGLMASALWADASRVEVVDNEVWLNQNGEAKQLTRDGKAKGQAILSAGGDRIAYYEQCPQSEGCTPSVVIVDLNGKRLQVFQPRPASLGALGPCASILDISWTRKDNVIGVECHANPSTSEYVEVDLTTGKNVRDLAGIEFTPSPDGKRVAHVGPLIHFAPPYAKSYTLMMDRMVVYPLPKHFKPVAPKPSEESLTVVKERGQKHIGIHEFGPQLVWSPTSEKIALIDCRFDWVETGGTDVGGNPIGDERNRRCSVAVVWPSGKFELFPLKDVPVTSIFSSRLLWIDDRRIQLEEPAVSPGGVQQRRTFKLR